MIEDKERWNKKYTNADVPLHVTPLIEKFLLHVKGTKALDIACGAGRNSKYLLDYGFEVDAVDISDIALLQVDSRANTIEVDLDSFQIPKNSYDLILNINYLDRKLIEKIKEALHVKGIIMFQTFVDPEEEGFKVPSNSAYLLRKNELQEAFIEFDIIYYEEYIDTNIRGEKVKIASLVAQK